MRVTGPLLKLLKLLLSAPDHSAYGLEIMDVTGISSGTMYPLLARLVREGMLEASKEELDPRVAGRPARIYYRLTATGVRDAQEILLEHSFRDEMRWTS